MEVMVLNLESIKDGKVSYIVKSNNDKFLLNIYIEDEDSKENTAKYKYGNVLIANCKLESSQKLGNPYEFDYKKYLNSNDICGLLTTNKVSLKSESNGNIFYKLILNYKEKLSEKIEANLLEDESNVLKAILYCDKLFLDEDINQSMSNIGISHILSISSFSIMYILFLADKLRSVYSQKKVTKIKIIILIFILALSNFKVSLIRTIIFYLVNLVFEDYIKINKNIKLVISAYIILFINPYYIFNISVIFSYLSVIFIMYFYGTINSFFNTLAIKIVKSKYKKSSLKNNVLKICFLLNKHFCLTFCVTIGTLPLQIYLYNSFNLITFLSNLIISPLILFVRVISTISMFCVYFFNISDILFNACFIPLNIIIKISKILENDITKISIATPSFISIIMYYMIFIMIIIKEKIIKKFVLERKILRNKLKLCIKLISIFFILFIIFEQVYINYFEEYILYFNVKQGNMAIIKKDRKTIIVDLGSTSKGLASNILNKYLKAKNIKKIDNIFITHFHADHMNGIYDISKDITIENVTYGKIWHTINEEYENFTMYIKKSNINTCEVIEGNEMKLSKNLSVYCVSPSENEKINSSDEINSNSAVYLFSINSSKKNNKFLFMGDATKETEKYILSKYIYNLESIDVLQIGHHGSKTSTSEELIKKTSPKISLISSYKKVYNHPSKETIQLLEKYNLMYHITEEDKVLKINI